MPQHYSFTDAQGQPVRYTLPELTTGEKIAALVDGGLADDAAEARAQLVDMGEIEEDDDGDDGDDGEAQYAAELYAESAAEYARHG